MNTNLDYNSWHLLEHQYRQSLPEKREAVLEYASEILKGHSEEGDFHMAFGHWYEEERGDYNAYILGVLDSWYQNELDTEDIPVIRELAHSALDAACEIVMGENIAVVSLEGCWNLPVMINELVGEL
jgi:hypothetical protein